MGTAFLVTIPLDEENGIVYAVTARHVIDASRPYGRLTIRFNNQDDEGFTDYWAPQDDWHTHPRSDVAVAPIHFDVNPDARWIDPTLFLTDERAKELELGEGDNVFFVGLFSEHFGQQRSQPVVRFGNVALMPREPLSLTIDAAPGAGRVAVDAYLVEARSWGGQSGSPAFAFFPTTRRMDTAFTLGPVPMLLGLVHGHYAIPQEVAFVGDALVSGRVEVNAGMAVVIPVQHILDVLNGPDLAAEREAALREHQARQTAAEPIEPDQ
ncbi:MAG: hypothetical protein WAQ33_03790 [Gaiellaceae bacterium]